MQILYVYIIYVENAEETVFTASYAKLTKVLNVSTLIPHFVTQRVFTIDTASDIRSCHQEPEKTMKFLDYIARHLKAEQTSSFYLMLGVMKKYGTITDHELANDMESSLQSLNGNSSKGMIHVAII